MTRKEGTARLDALEERLPTVKNGVCVLCGSGVLLRPPHTGEHLRDDLAPCFGRPATPG